MDQKKDAWIPLAMPIEAAMRTQRSIRRFKPDPVDDELHRRTGPERQSEARATEPPGVVELRQHLAMVCPQ
jgi:hypothetical protein